MTKNFKVVITVFTIVYITVLLLLAVASIAYGDTISGSYVIIKNSGQTVTLKYVCGSCNHQTSKHVITWPREGTTSTRTFTCSKCKKSNKVTLNGRNY